MKDIKAAVAAAEKAGGQVAMEPTEGPGLCTSAIYVQGAVDHGLWEKERAGDETPKRQEVKTGGHGRPARANSDLEIR